MPVVTFYTRKGCHLCEVARAEVERLRAEADFTLEIVDIDTDAELRRKFNEEVPVIFVNGRKAFKYRVDARRFLRLIRQ